MASWLSIGGSYTVGYNPSSCGTGQVNKLACYGNPTGQVESIIIPGGGLEFWQEDHGNVQFALWTTSPYLLKENVYPLIRIDTRRVRQPDGNLYFETGNYTTPEVFGESIYNGVLAFYEQWPSAKAFQYGLYLEGPDGSGSPLYMLRHPSDVIVSSIGSALPFNGIEQLRAYMTTACQVAYELIAADGLPDPMYCICNIESRGDVPAGIPLNYESLMLAHPLASSFNFDGSTNLTAWWAAHQLRPDGTAYPAYPVDGENAYHTKNWDRTQRLMQAVTMAYANAINECVANPMRAVWPDIQVGDWDLIVASRQSPTLLARPQTSYDGSGSLCGLDFSVPVYQACAHVTNAGAYDATNAGYPWQGNWANRYGTASTPANTLDVRLGAECLSEVVDGIIGNDLRRFFPNIGSLCSSSATDMADMRPTVAAAAADCWDKGAIGIYVYEPLLHTDADKQTQMANLVDDIMDLTT